MLKELSEKFKFQPGKKNKLNIGVLFQISGIAADCDELRHARLPDQRSGKGDTLMWPDNGIQSVAATQAHSLIGHEMDEDSDTGGQEQVIFDMDQGFPQSG